MSARATGAGVVLAAVLTGAGLFAATAGGERSSAARTGKAVATAYARDDGSGRTGLVSARTNGTESHPAGTRASASIVGKRASARASATVVDVSVFGGLVTADSVRVTARASYGEAVTNGSVIGLEIDGRPIAAPGYGSTYEIGRVGRVGVMRSGPNGILGLRVTLFKRHRGYPPGSEVVIGYASVEAIDGPAPAPPVRPKPPVRVVSPVVPDPVERVKPRRRLRKVERQVRRENSSARRKPRARRERRELPRAARRPAPKIPALRTSRGYVFPVYRDHAFSNDWGAPRPHTGHHEGNDIFAKAGTPVLAVTAGRLYRVGTRRIPGNRLWLRSARGDTFFYAHLSAFADDARNGARVKAGDVLGFVGNTGDAERTPPHLHFEIHPNGDGPINPYPFLRAWEQSRDVPHAAWLVRYGNDPGARPGALVMLEDFLDR